MKPSPPGASPHRRRFTATERERLLTELDRSGLTAAAFARERQLTYTTLCHWRHQRARGKRIAFAEVELVPPPVVEPLVIEFGSHARLRLSSPAQVELVATLLKHFQAPC